MRRRVTIPLCERWLPVNLLGNAERRESQAKPTTDPSRTVFLLLLFMKRRFSPYITSKSPAQHSHKPRPRHRLNVEAPAMLHHQRHERLWRSLKYAEVYRKADASAAEARRSLDVWLVFCNDVEASRSTRILASGNHRQTAQGACGFAAISCDMQGRNEQMFCSTKRRFALDFGNCNIYCKISIL